MRAQLVAARAYASDRGVECLIVWIPRTAPKAVNLAELRAETGARVRAAVLPRVGALRRASFRVVDGAVRLTYTGCGRVLGDQRAKALFSKLGERMPLARTIIST